MGSFAIFDERKYSRPYLQLDIGNDVTELTADEPAGFDDLKLAFTQNVLENTGLEQLRFNGTFSKMIEILTGRKREFYTGVRGNTNVRFDIYLMRNDSNIDRIKSYVGQAELDYTLWTDDSVFLFEAKKYAGGAIKSYLDIGWHKFAFAAIRFKNFLNLKIYPVYFLRGPKQVHLYAFPKFSFYGEGLILNDSKQMIPTSKFVVNL